MNTVDAVLNLRSGWWKLKMLIPVESTPSIWTKVNADSTFFSIAKPFL